MGRGGGGALTITTQYGNNLYNMFTIICYSWHVYGCLCILRLVLTKRFHFSSPQSHQITSADLFNFPHSFFHFSSSLWRHKGRIVLGLCYAFSSPIDKRPHFHLDSQREWGGERGHKNHQHAPRVCGKCLKGQGRRAYQNHIIINKIGRVFCWVCLSTLILPTI